ncbi:MAG: glutathione synthetase [Candidatus Binatia bacterium]|nr:MAG: glutathione synthetase [Candidatus Binatia bacterium]
MQRRFLFVMDPLDRILPDRDTTFVFMLEAERRGIEVYTCTVEHLFGRDSCPYALARRTIPSRGPAPFARYEERVEPLDFYDAVFMRKDPPFDQTYLFATHLLSLADPRRTFVINDPRGLRDANEKLYALHFPSVIPPTLVTSDIARIKAFLREQGGQAIIKPLDCCGGSGVFLASLDDRNLNALLELTTADGRRYVMAQRYLPEVRQGDKRILVLAGEPLGAILRVPQPDDHRGNIHVGGAVLPAELTARDREIVATLKPRLLADGLYFVGLDVIGGYLTEINVTSPTGIQEYNRLNNASLESVVIDFVLHRLPRQ